MVDIFHSHSKGEEATEGFNEETCDCANCAKIKKLGEHYENDAQRYCCEQCFKRGPIGAKDPQTGKYTNICEFC